ncbi:S26 family signal peptidase [Microbispora cellulosiformans]|uniref:S26 family signal peptidase n=1 Tax=Microbispora cellulosiformans TaxID=2614688 RepID=A0A5J5JRZ8_9ACTN|nr:S26 family signal peptidase [Microbispora cellulosiformans]KAA9373899.1 S26 family signal peptidase [Microbispora cellulosiformans]
MPLLFTVPAVMALALAAVTLGMRRVFVVVTVRGRSMQPTLRDGDRVLVRRRGVTAVRPDDLVVFTDVIDAPPVPVPAWAAEDDGPRTVLVVKRAIAVPGDPVPGTRVPVLAGRTASVPTGRLVVLGDNPAVSRDSRLYGYVAGERLLGVVIRRM